MDECTHISPANYRYLFSRLRKPKSLQVPLRFRATANPGGMYGSYYYERFFKEGPEKGRIFIPAGLNDNPYLDAEEYKEALNELDPLTREQLLNGNWEIKQCGDLFNSEWLSTIPLRDVPKGTKFVRWWDMASTDPTKRKKKSRGKDDPDWTVGFKLGFYQGMYFIMDIARFRKTPQESEMIMHKIALDDGYACAIRMEQEPGSSGEIAIDHYARGIFQGFNFQGVKSSGSKVERATPASSAMERGNILIVDTCRNTLEFKDELNIFPYGTHDDMVDGLSGSFNYFRKPARTSAPTGLKKASGSYWKYMNNRY